MDGFLGACGAVFLAIILIVNLSGHRKDMAALLTLTVCVMVALVGVQYIQPVLEFLEELEEIGGLDGEMIRILLKITGIGMISEIVVPVCADAGNASVGKSLQFLAVMVMLALSIPLFRSLILVVQEILGQL